MLQVRELVASGFTGEVEAFSLHHFRRPFKRDKWRHWIQSRRFSGGLIVEETCHWFDLLRFITGKEVASVQCRTTDRIHADFDFEDVAYIQGSLEGGGVFQIAHALSGFDFHLVHRRARPPGHGLVPAQGAAAQPPGRRAGRLLRPGGLGRTQPAAGDRRQAAPSARRRPNPGTSGTTRSASRSASCAASLPR